jgi:PAS domain S-box-containing protein
VTTGEAYRLLFEHVDNMICTLDLEGRFRSINAAGERLTGYTAEELHGRLAVDVIAPDQQARAVEQFARRLASGGEQPPDESVLVTRDGRRVPIEITSTFFVENGVPVGVLGLVRDLSERRRAADALEQSEQRSKRAEEALLQSERRFRSAFESAPIGMALVTIDGRFLQVNDSLCELVGYSTEELEARTWQDITHPDDLDADLGLASRVLAGELRTYQLEKRYFHRRGNVVWVLLSVSLVRASDGTPLHFIAETQDVTERKRAQETIERSERLLAEAQQIAHVGSWERDLRTDAMRPSEELCRIYGVDPATPEPTIEHFRELVHPEDRERVTTEITKTAREGEPFSLEYRVVPQNGGVRWVYARGEAVFENGRVVGIRGTAQDITERKEAEQRLAEAESRYRTLVEQLPIGSYIRPLDMSKPNIYASPQVEPMLGYSAEAWQSDPDLLQKIVHPDDRDRVLGAAGRLRTMGEPVHDEYRYIHRDGHVVWVQDETFVVEDENGEALYVQGFLMDISERKRAELERDRFRDELHHAQKLEAVGRLAGGVAHDFNNMLTAIRGYSELLLDGLPEVSPLRSEAEQIQRAVDQAAALPRQLLAFSRKQSLEPELVDLNDVVESMSDLLRRLISEAITLETVPRAAPATVSVDPGQIEQMLVNLALNARDAMPDGGALEISTWNLDVTEASAADYEAAPGRYVVVSIHDTGQGMDAQTRARAFEPFFTTKPQGEGSGLGLASVYGSVVQSGGFVRLETEVGQGSTFHMHFPFVAGTVTAPLDTGTAEPVEEKLPSVLLAEDEAIVRDLAVAVLERAGFRVQAAADGVEALDLFQRLGEVDVLVTDMVMPRVGGRELAERVLEARPDTPIVYMSGYTEEAPVAGAAFLEKPFSKRALVRAVEAAVEQSELDDARPERAAEPVRGVPAGAPTCVVADDHPAVLDSVSRFLVARGFDVVARAARGDEALAEIESRRPAVALVDIAMEPINGIEVARRAAVSAPQTRIVLYTGHRDRALLGKALEVGARGFVLKEAALYRLLEALRIVAEGGVYVDPELSAALASSSTVAALSPLTPREREILLLLADGMTNEKAASKLGISAETVQSHVRNAMGKLEADTRTEAVATALRESLIA